MPPTQHHSSDQTGAQQQTPATEPKLLAEYISDAEFCAEMGLKPRTTQRQRHARTGPPYVVIARRVYYRRDAVKDWLLKRQQGGKPNGARPRSDRGR